MTTYTLRTQSRWFNYLLAGLFVGAFTVGMAEATAQESPDGPTVSDGQSTSSADSNATSQMDDQERQQKFKRHVRRGAKAYEARDFERAGRELQAAYQLNERSSILFNLGMISEKSGQLKKAADYYRQFIGAPDVKLKARQRAAERLAVVTEVLQAEDQSNAATTTNLMPALEAMNSDLATMDQSGDQTEQKSPETPASGRDESANKEAESSDVTASRETSAPPVERTQRSQRPARGPRTDNRSVSKPPSVDYGWPVYTSFGLATAALGGGAVALLVSSDRASEAAGAAKAGNADKAADYRSQQDSYSTMSTGLFIGGGALVALGSYFVITKSMEAAASQNIKDGPADSTTPSVSLSVSRRFTGAVVSVGF